MAIVGTQPWSREEAELFRRQLTPRAAEILDTLAAEPQRRFTGPELISALHLESESVLSGLLGDLTKAAKRAHISQEEPHSWFVLWSDENRYLYWLDQERADWWLGNPTRKLWALVGDPEIGYDPICAIQSKKTDLWTTKGKEISTGDRVAIWKNLGGPDFPEKRGIVAFGEVISEPQVRGDPENPCMSTDAPPSIREERVEVRYHPLKDRPLWLGGEFDKLLGELSVSRARGGAVFSITNDQWERLLRVAGGWPLLISKEQGGWTPGEVRAIVESYLAMLREELSGKPYSKTESRRAVQLKLLDRTEGAIELKCQNISAVLSEMGLPYIHGYKPRRHFQIALRSELRRQLNAGRELNELFAEAAHRPPPQNSVNGSSLRQVQPPKVARRERTRQVRRGARVDYIAQEAKNSSLGRAGEKLVMESERDRLREAGREDLAEQVRWVSQEDGDGFGYDIDSFEPNGCPIFIEVKTTGLGIEATFFVSPNELQASQELGDAYRLYRVFDFGTKPSFFVLKGPLDTLCTLAPASYKAWPSDPQEDAAKKTGATKETQ